MGVWSDVDVSEDLPPVCTGREHFRAIGDGYVPVEAAREAVASDLKFLFAVKRLRVEAPCQTSVVASPTTGAVSVVKMLPLLCLVQVDPLGVE